MDTFYLTLLNSFNLKTPDLTLESEEKLINYVYTNGYLESSLKLQESVFVFF